MTKDVKYLALDGAHNALDYLFQSLVFLAQVEQNLFYLKWFVISFHSAVYGFMLLVLQAKDHSLIYEVLPGHLGGKKKQNGFDPLEGKLISFTAAYKYLKNSTKMNGKPFPATNQQSICITELNNKLRSQMVHFKPMVWASESWYPARVCQPLLDLLRFCIKDDGVHLDKSEKNSALAYLESIDKLLIKHAE